MKRFALIAFALAAASAPVAAQYVSDAEPFLTAVRSRDGNKATELLESRPALLNSRNLKGETALTIVIARGDDLWTKFLLGKGADPNLADGGGNTPLIVAARVGYTDAVDMLLQLGAKVDATNKMGETALILAVQQRQLESVKLLLARGANPDKKDAAAGYSARDYAKRDTRNREIIATIEAAGKAKPAKTDDLDSFKLK
ncbi:ankyrin repeat domain-containing protein [Sphingomonas daechungensis]|uniref:ankyrin repeat domain-containing protein n=1 Tax=Sphingomonas daechungensis TaxID=1176646 RepID=UPI00378372D9